MWLLRSSSKSRLANTIATAHRCFDRRRRPPRHKRYGGGGYKSLGSARPAAMQPAFRPAPCQIATAAPLPPPPAPSLANSRALNSSSTTNTPPLPHDGDGRVMRSRLLHSGGPSGGWPGPQGVAK